MSRRATCHLIFAFFVTSCSASQLPLPPNKELIPTSTPGQNLALAPVGLVENGELVDSLGTRRPPIMEEMRVQDPGNNAPKEIQVYLDFLESIDQDTLRSLGINLDETGNITWRYSLGSDGKNWIVYGVTVDGRLIGNLEKAKKWYLYPLVLRAEYKPGKIAIEIVGQYGIIEDSEGGAYALINGIPTPVKNMISDHDGTRYFSSYINFPMNESGFAKDESLFNWIDAAEIFRLVNESYKGKVLFSLKELVNKSEEEVLSEAPILPGYHVSSLWLGRIIVYESETGEKAYYHISKGEWLREFSEESIRTAKTFQIPDNLIVNGHVWEAVTDLVSGFRIWRNEVHRKVAVEYQTKRSGKESTMIWITKSTPPLDSEAPISLSRQEIESENFESLTLVGNLGRGPIQDVAITPNNKSMAVGTPTGIHLFDLETLEEIRFIETGAAGDDLVFSPDGTLLAASIDAGTALINVSTGKKVMLLERRAGFGGLRAFSPNGQFIFAEGVLWKLPEGEKIYSFDKAYTKPYFINDGNTLVIWSIGTDPYSKARSFVIDYWEIPELSLIKSKIVSLGNSGLSGVDLSGDGSRASVSYGDGRTLIYNMEYDNPRPEIIDFNETASADEFSHSGEVLAVVASYADKIRLLNAVSGNEIFSLEQKDVMHLAFSSDDKFIVSASPDSLIIWQAATGAKLRVMDNYFYSSSFEAHGFVASHSAQMTNIWTLNDLILNASIPPQLQLPAVDDLLISPDGVFVASWVSKDWYQQLTMWRSSDGTMLWTRNFNNIFNIGFSPDSKLLGIQDANGNILIMDVFSRELKSELDLHLSDLESFAGNGFVFLPDGTGIASVRKDAKIVLFDLDGVVIQTFSGFKKYTLQIAFSKDNGFLLARGIDEPGKETIKIWRMTDGRIVNTITTYCGAMALSPDGRFLVVNSDQHHLAYWEISTGTMLGRVSIGPTCSSISFSPDGRFLLADIYGILQIWAIPEKQG